MLSIPFVPSIPFYRFSTAINNVEYFFDVRWNGRDHAWYFDVSTLDETVIVSGVKIVLGIFLGRRTEHPLFREGVMVALDNSGQGIEADLDDLGGRVEVRWIPIEEVLAMRENSDFPW